MISRLGHRDGPPLSSWLLLSNVQIADSSAWCWPTGTGGECTGAMNDLLLTFNSWQPCGLTFDDFAKADESVGKSVSIIQAFFVKIPTLKSQWRGRRCSLSRYKKTHGRPAKSFVNFRKQKNEEDRTTACMSISPCWDREEVNDTCRSALEAPKFTPFLVTSSAHFSIGGTPKSAGVLTFLRPG